MTDDLLFALLAGAMLGAAIGSFVGCAAWRLPRRQSMTGRSHCPGCDTPVPAHLNVPVLAFVLLRGRSRCCQQAMSKGYLIWELSSAAAGAALTALVGLPALFAAAVAVLAAVSVAGELRARESN